MLRGVGFAGIKGFAGGFGRRMLEPWGEPLIKQFVQEAVLESTKLESALARLRVDTRVVLMHYSPIEGTVDGRGARDAARSWGAAGSRSRSTATA